MGGLPFPWGAGVSETYMDWQERLARAFVVPSAEPFVMFLDEDEAQRLWPHVPDAVADLSRAVSAEIDWGGRKESIFRRINYAVTEWDPADGPPPTLPLLAVTVVAACRMHRDTSYGSNAYFIRVAQVLRPELAHPHLASVREQLREGFGAVATWWRQLDHWLRSNTDRAGPSTIHEHPKWTRVGYPMSQALIRRSDRLRVTALFALLRIDDQGVPDAETLLRSAQVWASRAQGLSSQFTSALAGRDTAPLLADPLHRLAVAWDGVTRSMDGKARLDLRIVLDLDAWTAGFAIPVVPAVDHDKLQVTGGGVLSIERTAPGTLYRLYGEEILPSVADALAGGVTATGEHCTAVLAGNSAIVALRENADAGGWMSEDRLVPFEDHLLAVEPKSRPDVEAFLASAAEPGWERLHRDATLLPGWVTFTGVRLESGSAFEAAARLSPKLASQLRPDAGLRARLVNGLPLGRPLATGHYLEGGEPDLLLPVGPKPRAVTAALDGLAQEYPFTATGFPIELRRRGGFGPGPHHLVADGDRLRFDLHESLPTRRDPAQQLAWRPCSGLRHVTAGPLGDADVAGARAPGSGPEAPRLVRRGVSAWLVRADGIATPVAEPPVSAWVSQAGITPYRYAVWPDPNAVWLVITSAGRPREPQLVRPCEPEFASLDAASAQLWAVLERAPAPDSPLWLRYLAAWRRQAR